MIMDGYYYWEYVCVICNKDIVSGLPGNNPSPIASKGECCNECNNSVVITARLKEAGIN